jgi:hypothetical protein
MSDSYTEIENAIAYFEDAVKESDEIINDNDCSPELQKELTKQKEHFIVALSALHKKAEKPSAAEEVKRNCTTAS